MNSPSACLPRPRLKTKTPSPTRTKTRLLRRSHCRLPPPAEHPGYGEDRIRAAPEVTAATAPAAPARRSRPPRTSPPSNSASPAGCPVPSAFFARGAGPFSRGHAPLFGVILPVPRVGPPRATPSACGRKPRSRSSHVLCVPRFPSHYCHSCRLHRPLTLSARAQFTLEQISMDKFTNSDSVHEPKSSLTPLPGVTPSSLPFTSPAAPAPSDGVAPPSALPPPPTAARLDLRLSPRPHRELRGRHLRRRCRPLRRLRRQTWRLDDFNLPLIEGNRHIGDVVVSRSADGIHWGNPILIDGTHNDDKNWTVCDNTATSPFYGNCYTEWDAATSSGFLEMSTSSDGGLTWGPGQDHC